MKTTFIFALALLMLTGCGGGTNTTQDHSSATAGPPPPEVPTFSVLAGYRKLIAGGSAFSFDILGACHGTAVLLQDVPVAATFEGRTAVVADTGLTMYLPKCSSSTLSAAQTDYFDANFFPIGSVVPGFSYGVAASPSIPMPASVKVGDSGIYSTMDIYTTDAKTVRIGKLVHSYVVSADPSNAARAILGLVTKSYNATEQILYTQDSRFSMDKDGTLTPQSIDIKYSANDAEFVLEAQPTTLRTIDLVVGAGAIATPGKTVNVSYTGWLYDPAAPDLKGARFDTSIGGTPFEFSLGAGQVIPGWDQGVAGMKIGGKRTLIIPSELAYRSSGNGAAIPPYSVLVFEVELVNVK